MYTPAQEQQLYTEAKSLLTETGQSPEQMDDLQNILRWADWKYYVQSEPVLADYEYDLLFKKLRALEEAYPEQVSADSPTQRVAKGLSERFPTVAHLVPMLSLDNTYNAADLADWDRKVRAGAGEGAAIQYCAEPKYDGASISLVYEDDKMVRGATRGDGVMGEDITANIRQIRAIPLAAPFTAAGLRQIEIRGEVVIHKETFAAYNAQRAAEGLSPLANPRNAASGTLRMLDPAEVSRRKLTAILYHVSEVEYSLPQTPSGLLLSPSEGGGTPDMTTIDTDISPSPPSFGGGRGEAKEGRGTEAANQGEAIAAPNPLSNHHDTLQWLYSLGFPTPAKELRLFDSIEEVIAYCNDFETRRDGLPFEVDGLVIKVNDLALQEKLGMTSHHPRWAVAYKFAARQATSKLRQVIFNVGRTGSVTPVAKIDPVGIGGVTVTSVSLFNEDVIREKDVRIGDTVLVERAGDVIPYIVKPLAELRDGTEQAIIYPTVCPVCEEALERPQDEAVWRCINIACPAQVLERIAHFCSKDAMDIRGMGESNVKKFYDLDIVTGIPGLYSIVWERVSALEGFGEKSVTNLRAAIEKSKAQPLSRLIFGLGIRHVGETTGKVLGSAVGHIRELYDWDEARLTTLEDIGPKVAASVTHFFRTPEARHTIDALEAAGVNLANLHKSAAPADGAFSGKTFLFTGTMARLKRSEAEAMVAEKGGSILGGVSSKLNYLVVGADAGSKLEKAKKLGTISILNEADFLEMADA